MNLFNYLFLYKNNYLFIYIMEEIRNQISDNISDQVIYDKFIYYNSNVVDTLTDLWNIEEKSQPISNNKKKWNEIRDIFDSFDKEANLKYKNN